MFNDLYKCNNSKPKHTNQSGGTVGIMKAFPPTIKEENVIESY
uniref:Uncharacterized protein n=1 Tax=Virgibacillus oceani TaxID=1479511 RepID=A0A917HJ68_9BACI|nr:hypothetical protein GCM10011398_28530 [Virgibacillus oceani]